MEDKDFIKDVFTDLRAAYSYLQNPETMHKGFYILGLLTQKVHEEILNGQDTEDCDEEHDDSEDCCDCNCHC